MAKEKIYADTSNMYTALFENMIDGFAIHKMLYDKEGNPEDYIFLDVNPQFEKLTGLKKTDIVNKRVLEVLPETEDYWIRKYGDVVKTGNPLEFEDYSGNLGKYYSVRAYKSGADQFAVTFQDITETKTFHGEIIKSETKYRLLFESMHQGVFYQNADGKLIDVNIAALNMFGISKEEFLARTSEADEWNVIDTNGNSLPGKMHPSMMALRSGKPVYDYELAVLNKKLNEYIWLIVNAVPEFRENEKKPYRVAVTLQDITDRKKAENKYKESMAMADALLNASADAAFLMSVDGTLLAVNEEIARRLKGKREELVGKNAFKILPVHVAKHRKEKVDQAAKTGKTVNFIDSRDGRIIDNRISPVLDSDGKVRMVAAFGKDITEFVESIDAIKESEERYRRLIETANEGIWIIDGNMETTFVNRKMAGLLGYPESEINGRSYFDFIAEEDIKLEKEEINLSRKGKSRIYERRFIKKGGEEVWGLVSASPLFDKDEKFSGSLAMITDITERKRIEESLKENEILLSMTQRIAKVGGWEWDIKKRSMTWTDETFRLHGIVQNGNEEDTARLIDKSIECYAPEDRDKILNAFKSCINEGTEYDMEFQFRSFDGENKWIKTAAKPVYENGKIVKVVGEIQDITDIKVAQLKLKETNERMAALLTAMPDMMFIISGDGTYLEYYGSSKDLYSSENLFIGKKVGNIMPAEMAERTLKIIDEVIKTEMFNVDTYSLTIDGQEKYFEARFVKCGHNMVLVIVRDITSDKKSEAEINEKNILLNAVLQHTNMMSVYLDCDFNFIWVNKSYADTCGYDVSFFKGKNHFQLYPHQENEAIFRHVVNSGEPYYVSAKPFVFPDQPNRGITYWDWSLIPVKDYTGKISGLVFTLVDVTAKQDAANELQRAYLRLNALWNLSKIAEQDLFSVYDNILDASVKMTESEFGFFGIVNEDETKVTIHKWYGITMDECRVENRPVEYLISESGVWAEAIRNRDAVILNDFSASHHAKKGFPKGHIHFNNLLAVPGFKGDKIVSVVAVADKVSDYSDSDIKQMKAFLSSAQLIIDRKQAEDSLVKSLKEKELLLKEIHHRVKNNFQLIVGLISIQASIRESEAEERLLANLQNRIKSMSLIHELMYSSGNLSDINASEYINTLAEYLRGAFTKGAKNIKLLTEINNINIEPAVLIPVGIIINELVSNSIEHAFTGKESGTISIICQTEDGANLSLIVKDDGSGFTADYAVRKEKSMGLFLVETLARQLKGELLINSSVSGTEIKLEIGKYRPFKD